MPSTVRYKLIAWNWLQLDLEHIQRLVAEKQLDEKLKEMKLRSDDEKIKHQNYGPMPEMIDDFIRNYFRNMGLNKTLASVSIKHNLSVNNWIKQFQSEWFELEHKGLTEGKVIDVPSVYQENQQITKQLTRLKHELDLKIMNLNTIRKMR